MIYRRLLNVFFCLLAVSTLCRSYGQSWTPDNGNGTFTNPLFYDEFSDPDMIRVGDDFFFTGTTMHSFPGLPVLHSKDLVNWELLGYAFDSLSMGPEFRLENGKEAYGQGIWAPCIRYNKGMFYIFSNINGHGMQVFTAKNPAGPWKHTGMDTKIYDLSVLFDDDGKIYAVYNYDEVRLVQLKPDLSGVVEGTERVIIPHGNAMGEGHHMYKMKGKYYIISANFSPTGRMQCARAENPYGPYETVTISADETMGTTRGPVVANVGLGRPVPDTSFAFRVLHPSNNEYGAVPMHQGGIVDLPNGDWWGFSMMDFHSVGRTTFLSPVTWQDGWPYFGLPGNPGRSPRTWLKPAVGLVVAPAAPYQRSDDFSGPRLRNAWQWNHEPVNNKWELDKKKGCLRLHTLPATDFLWAKNTLTQRVIGPQSSATVSLDAGRLAPGDYAGLAILNMPYAALGVLRNVGGYWLRFYDQFRHTMLLQKLLSSRVVLRITGDYDCDLAQFSYCDDGKGFTNIGDSVGLPYQLKTFQGSRYALFAYNTTGQEGGLADFDDFTVAEPMADRSKNVPLGSVIALTNLATGNPAWASPHGMLQSAWPGSKEVSGPGCRFRVHDRGKGRVVLEALNGTGFVTVVGLGLSSDVRLLKTESAGSLFQWQDLLRGECMLLSLKTNRYMGLRPETRGPYSADFPGTRPDRKDGAVFRWQVLGADSLTTEASPSSVRVVGNGPVAAGKFEASWVSLQQYRVPEWYRNAKFGIWAHWGPQCEPGQGDWYARLMYIEGSRQYKWQVEHYGHPSNAGFKDVVHQWKAEHWDPEKLVALYKRAGAQYFFAMANHHDNVDMWDSKYQEWNTVRVGPHKDILAGWAKAAKDHHLPFGLSVHAAHAWTWYEVAQRVDTSGEFKAIPYDAKLTKADGKGTWWEGLDPQELYAQDHPLSRNSESNNAIHSEWDWGNGAAVPSQAYCEKFYNRTVDMINRYHPDLLYFDDTGLPLYPVSDVGLKIAAHFYNSNMAQHDGKLEGVLFGKILTPEQKKCLVWDVERGSPDKIQDLPWQTCTCIGDWHYNTAIYERNGYKSAKAVIRMLIDVVSKNGNLLLNVPVRGDGTLDEKEIAIVQEIAAWMDVNKESIFDTRPWRVFGEGPSADATNPIMAQGFNEGRVAFTAKDIRFNQKGNILYVTVMGLPEANIVIRNLASPARIRKIELLGSKEKVKWEQGSDGLEITTPASLPNKIALVYKVDQRS
jgi:alpha-L-fucosidase/beta-xylosidase